MRRRQNKVKQISSSELVPPWRSLAARGAGVARMPGRCWCIETMNPPGVIGCPNLFDSAGAIPRGSMAARWNRLLLVCRTPRGR